MQAMATRTPRNSPLGATVKVDFNQILTKTLLRARKKLRRNRLKKRTIKHQARLWDQRLAFETGHTSFFDRNSFLALFLNTESLSLHYINARALTKYGRAAYIQNLPIEKRISKKSPSAFVKHLDREIVRRYKYSAVQIRNIIRAAYVGFYIKNPTLITQLLAYALPKLPRNRKETKFLRFRIKLAKVRSASRWEILGIKLEFQGRVNRWRRTKCMQASYGLIPSVTFVSRIEYGSSQSITRKGARAIRLWIVYKPVFGKDLKIALKQYIIYSIKAQNLKSLQT